MVKIIFELKMVQLLLTNDLNKQVYVKHGYVIPDKRFIFLLFTL